MIINAPLYFYTSLNECTNECTNDIPTHNIMSDLDHTLRKFFTITILEPHFKTLEIDMRHYLNKGIYKLDILRKKSGDLKHLIITQNKHFHSLNSPFVETSRLCSVFCRTCALQEK